MNRTKKIRKILKAGVVITLVLALVMSSTAVFANVYLDTSTDDIITTSAKKLAQPLHRRTEMPQSKIKEIAKIDKLDINPIKPMNFYPLALGEDIPIMASDLYSFRNPTVASDGNNILVLGAGSESVLDSAPWIQCSSDSGETWLEDFWGVQLDNYIDLIYADYTADSEMQAYVATATDPFTDQFYIWTFPSLTDPDAVWEDREGWFSGWALTWNTGAFDEFYDTSLCGYPHGEDVCPFPDFHGMYVFSALDSDGYSYYLYCETDDNLLSLWMGVLDHEINNVDVDIDTSTGWEYDIWDFTNDPELADGSLMEALWLEPGNPEWFTVDENYGPSWHFEGCMNPSIRALGGNVYIVGEKNGDIVSYYSHNEGVNFTEVIVTNTVGVESDPDVSIVSENIVICCYERDENLYNSISEDGGVTWTETPQVNDESSSVVEDSYPAIANQFVFWTDNRLENEAIYFEGAGTAAPIIKIGAISGGLGVSTVISNTGTGDATDMDCSIKVTGGLLGKINTEITETIDLPAGETYTINSGIILGIGSVTVTVKAGGVKETADGSQILIFTMI